jgi:peptide/nickel transport system substrate-binding protein
MSGPGLSSRNAYLDQIVLTVIPDAATAVAAFQAGQLDVYPSTFQNLQVIKQSVPDAVVGDYQNLSISGLAVNVKVKPLDDIRVRQAMWYGINQQEIINTVFQGDGVKGRVVPPAYTGWTSNHRTAQFGRNREERAYGHGSKCWVR